MIKLKTQVPTFSQLLEAIGGEGRAILSETAGVALFALIQTHLRQAAASRHVTAGRLGAWFLFAPP